MFRFQRPTARPVRRAIGLGFALAAMGLVASLLPAMFMLEEALGLGALFAIRGPVAPPAEVVVIGISRESAQALGQTSELDTWPRELHARLVERLRAAGATAVAFDLLFTEAREGPGDALFRASIERAGNVLLLEETGDSDAISLGSGPAAWREQRTPPLLPLKEAAFGSAPFILPTVPLRVGQSWTFDRVTEEMPSLPALALQAHLLPYYDDFVRLLERARPGVAALWPQTSAAVRSQRNLELTMGTIRRTLQSDDTLRDAAVAELAGGPRTTAAAVALRVLLDLYSGPNSRYLNFYGPARAIRTVPYDRAFAEPGDLELAGKVVLVGVSEPRQPRQQDDFISVFSESSGINLSGVEVGATALANLLEQRTLQPLPLSLHAALTALLGFAFGSLIGRLSMARAGAVAVFGTAGYLMLALWQFTSYHVWLPLVVPLLVQVPVGLGAAVWWNYREVSRQRERVRTALGYYVPKSVARRLSDQAVTVGANRELLHGTCLVTDAEHYTSIGETLAPADLAALMNDYYDAIFRVVATHGGEISDTAGDSMIAVWASAAPDPRVRLHAAEAAIAILTAVEEFNRVHPHSPLPTRIGLESGEMLLGNIGAEQRYEYRAIGDIVNTASRIQGLNQQLGTQVLLSAATLDGTKTLATRDVGTFLFRGKRLPVRVLEPLAASACKLDDDSLAEFAAAMVSFRAGEWRDAQQQFAALSARFPTDGPSRYYDLLAGEWRRTPPSTWTGAVRLTAK
jgi:adenylate cyclase